MIPALLILHALAQGPPPRMPDWARDRPYTTSGTQVVSPTVVATWMKRVHGERETVEIVVLWRGAPGWFIPGSHRSAGGGSGDSWSAQIEYAGIPLSVAFNHVTRVAEVQGRTMTLAKDVNVLLVDGVGGPDAALAIGTAFVEPATPSRGNPMPPLLRQSDRLIEFLQCDVKVPQVSAQPAIDRLCAQVRSGR